MHYALRLIRLSLHYAWLWKANREPGPHLMTQLESKQFIENDLFLKCSL